MKRIRRGDQRRLAYRFFEHDEEPLVLIDVESSAEYNERIHRALKAKTWEEFRKLMPRDEYACVVREIDESRKDCGEPPLRRTGPFDPLTIPGYGDGDYLPWAAASLEQVIPQDLLERYAKREANMVNGAWWVITKECWQPLKSELEARGFRLIERSDLEYLQ